MSNQEAAIQAMTEALEAKGLHVMDIGANVLNVHNGAVTADGSRDDATYLFSVVVSANE